MQKKITKKMLHTRLQKAITANIITAFVAIVLIICMCCFVGIKFKYVEAAFENTPLQTETQSTETPTPGNTNKPTSQKPTDPPKPVEPEFTPTALVASATTNKLFFNTDLDKAEVNKIINEIDFDFEQNSLPIMYLKSNKGKTEISFMRLTGVISYATADDFVVFMNKTDGTVKVIYSTVEFYTDGIHVIEGACLENKGEIRLDSVCTYDFEIRDTVSNENEQKKVTKLRNMLFSSTQYSSYEQIVEPTPLKLNSKVIGVYINDRHYLPNLEYFVNGDCPELLLAEFEKNNAIITISALNLTSVGMSNNHEDYAILCYCEQLEIKEVLYTTKSFNFNGFSAQSGYYENLNDQHFFYFSDQYKVTKNRALNCNGVNINEPSLIDWAVETSNSVLSSTPFQQ